MLGDILDRLGDPVLCPHVLAETSNLLGYRQTPAQQVRWRKSLADVIQIATGRTEQSVLAVADRAYLRLGMTDAILLMLAADLDLVLVSDDLQLCIEAERRGAKTVNYNYLRDGALRVDQL